MRRNMRSEQGQASVEWTALLLLAALLLAALTHLAPKADGQELGPTLAHSVMGVEHRSAARRQISSTHLAPTALEAAVRSSLPRLPTSVGRIGRGAGAVWRKAWFGCLVYARTRYALRHPESRIPGYTLPYGTALRMVTDCLSPVDLLGDLPELDPSP
jgi:hypothetical protein